MRRPALGRVLLVLVVLAVAVPFIAVLSTTFGGSLATGLDTASPWARILGSRRTWRVIALTIGQAVGSTAVTVVIGIPVAYTLARYRFFGRSVLATLAVVPFVLPSVVVGAAFASIFGARGVLDGRGSWWLIIAAHVCFNISVVVRTVGAAIERGGGDSEAAARLLGRSGFATFREVTLPRVASSIAASAVIVFLFSLTSFGVIVILGGGSVTTIEVEIWVRATRQFDISGAAVLSALQLIAVASTLAADIAIARHSKVSTLPSEVRRQRPSEPLAKALVITSVLSIVLICGVPLAALAFRSLQVPGGLGLDNWTSLGSVLEGTDMTTSPISATINSLRTSMLVSLLTVALALPTARYLATRRGRVEQGLVLLPLGVSATTIGLGLLIAFGRPPVDLRGSGLLIPLAQLLVALPLVTRVMVPPIRSLDRAQLDAAEMLGAVGPTRFWRVDLPHLRTALRSAAALGFVVCLGEFGATVFVSRGDEVTMPVLLQQLMSRPGGVGYGQSMAVGVLMVVVCGVVLWIADRMGSSGATVMTG
ncbi:MAG: iron ABC transporter permease [Microthrixaceae bacterium]